MTYKVKQFIMHKCNICRGYECNQDKRWDPSEFEDDDVHYCATLERHINGGTTKQCDDQSRFEKYGY